MTRSGALLDHKGGGEIEGSLTVGHNEPAGAHGESGKRERMSWINGGREEKKKAQQEVADGGLGGPRWTGVAEDMEREKEG